MPDCYICNFVIAWRSWRLGGSKGFRHRQLARLVGSHGLGDGGDVFGGVAAAAAGQVEQAGGCCGNTPEHIAAIAQALSLIHI